MTAEANRGNAVVIRIYAAVIGFDFSCNFFS